jgi:hypothetical protein
MALTANIDATVAAIMSEIQLLTPAEQAGGTASMKIVVTKVMEHILANGIVVTNSGQLLAVDPITHLGSTTAPGTGSLS